MWPPGKGRLPCDQQVSLPQKEMGGVRSGTKAEVRNLQTEVDSGVVQEKQVVQEAA